MTVLLYIYVALIFILIVKSKAAVRHVVIRTVIFESTDNGACHSACCRPIETIMTSTRRYDYFLRTINSTISILINSHN